MNNRFSLHNRKTAFERLARIPHRDRKDHLTDCILNLLSDDKISIEERYSLFSNNPFLDNDVQTRCHLFYFNNFNPPRYPIRLKLNSAQYLLHQNNSGMIDTRDVCAYLFYTSRTTSDPNVRAECADILSRNGYREGNQILEEMAAPLVINQYNQTRTLVEPRIENLPEERRRILVKRRTVYDDGQNVHNSSLNEGVKAILKKLIDDHRGEISRENRMKNLNEVSRRIVSLSADKSPVSKKKINGTIDRILIDTSVFVDDATLCDVLILVWIKIKGSKDKDELEKRLLEELEEMNGLCATGHLSRLINVLSGFFEGMSVGISYRDQIKNYLYNHYNKLLMSERYFSLSETIVEEMTESEREKKGNLLKMVEDNDISVYLRNEFREVEKEDFEKWFKEALDGYCGLV